MVRKEYFVVKDNNGDFRTRDPVTFEKEYREIK